MLLNQLLWALVLVQALNLSEEMKAFILIFLLFLPILSMASPHMKLQKPAQKAEPLSFSMWKQEKIRSAYKAYQMEKKAHQQSRGNVFEKKHSYQQVIRAKQVLDYSRKISVNDYFEMYLIQKYPNNINMLERVVKGLSIQQVSQLLASYQRHLSSNALKPYEK